MSTPAFLLDLLHRHHPRPVTRLQLKIVAAQSKDSQSANADQSLHWAETVEQGQTKAPHDLNLFWLLSGYLDAKESKLEYKICKSEQERSEWKGKFHRLLSETIFAVSLAKSADLLAAGSSSLESRESIDVLLKHVSPIEAHIGIPPAKKPLVATKSLVFPVSSSKPTIVRQASAPAAVPAASKPKKPVVHHQQPQKKKENPKQKEQREKLAQDLFNASSAGTDTEVVVNNRVKVHSKEMESKIDENAVSVGEHIPVDMQQKYKEPQKRPLTVVDSDDEEEDDNQSTPQVEQKQEHVSEDAKSNDQNMNVSSDQGTVRKVIKRVPVQKKRVYKDAWGKMVTETITEYEECEVEERQDVHPHPPSKQNSWSSTTGKKKAKQHNDSDGKKQAGIMSFFKKS